MIRRIIFLALLAGSATANAVPAQKFLSDAIKGDNSEMRLGRLIASRGESAAVRSFGRALTADHQRARVQAGAVARRMGMAPPTAMMPEARAEYTKLSRLHGARFDREVGRYMIDDHRKDIAEFRKQARTGDRGTSSLAAAQLPALRKHLSMAEALPR